MSTSSNMLLTIMLICSKSSKSSKASVKNCELPIDVTVVKNINKRQRYYETVVKKHLHPTINM